MPLRTAPDLVIELAASCADAATTVRLDLAGELVIHTAARARAAITDLVDDPAPSVTIDLSEVSLLDAAGLIAVTSPALACRRAGKDVSIVPPRAAEARRVADLVGVLPMLSGGRR